MPFDLRPYVHLSLDLRILVFTFALTVLTTLLFGLIPAYRMSAHSPAQLLQSGSRATNGGFNKLSLSGVLVTVQIGVALVLLSGAGLLIQSLIRLENVNPGFQTNHLLTARLNLEPNKYPDIPAQNAMLDELINKSIRRRRYSAQRLLRVYR